MLNYINQHPGIVVAIVGFVASTAVSSLPPPLANSGEGYKFLYKFANGLLANVSALRGKAQFEE